MPFVLGFLGVVFLLGLGVGLYAIVSNPNRKTVRLDANHHEMYALLVELNVKDGMGTPIFDLQNQRRVKTLIANYKKEITS